MATLREERDQLSRKSPFLLGDPTPDLPKINVEYQRDNGSYGKHELLATNAESAESII
jgi:hypothetical protein